MAESGADGIKVRWLIRKEDGAPNFAMRSFELAPLGHSPLHSHDWEHEAYILEGKGEVVCNNETRRVNAGYVVFIPPKAKHQFRNIGETKLKFLCLVPHHE